MGRRYFDDAVRELDEHVQSKTSHSTKALIEHMQYIVGKGFANQMDRMEFGQLCHNFEVYSKEHNKKSWGRKQFEAWWNVQDIAPGEIDVLPNLKTKEEMEASEEPKRFAGVVKRNTITVDDMSLYQLLPEEEEVVQAITEANPFDEEDTAGGAMYVKSMDAYIDTLEAENKRLKERLNKIAKMITEQ